VKTIVNSVKNVKALNREPFKRMAYSPLHASRFTLQRFNYSQSGTPEIKIVLIAGCSWDICCKEFQKQKD
jgi:hypothetical protein